MPSGALHEERPAHSPMATIVIAGSIITAISLGVRATMGLFTDEVDMALGVGADTFGLTIAVQNLVWGLSQPLVGTVADRFGAGRVLAVGAAVYAGGLLVMANADGAAGLYTGGGLIVGLGMSAASFAVVLSSIGKLVEPDRRSMALGITTAFGSFGHFLLVPVTRAFIDLFGWRGSLVALAAVTMVIAAVVRPLRTGTRITAAEDANISGPGSIDPGRAGPHQESLGQLTGRALRHRDYLLVNAAFFVCGFHVTFIGVHLPKSLIDAGYGSSVATWSLALIGLFNIFGAFSAGLLGARFNTSRLLSIIYVTRALAFAGLLVLPVTPAVALGFGALLGVVWLASVPLTSSIVLGQFGVRSAGTLFGFVFLSHQVGAFLGSWGAGEIRELTGSYDLWWWLAAALGVMAAVIHFSISDEPVRSSQDLVASPAPAPTAGASAGIAAQPPRTP